MNNYVAGVTERFNASAPVGFQCRDVSYGFDWTKGHCGRLLPDDMAEKLEEYWETIKLR